MAKYAVAEENHDFEPLEPSTLPSTSSFRFDPSDDHLSRAGSGYDSHYGSLFGSAFSLADGSGVFVSSLALTIIISAIVIVGIVLVAIIITLAVLLSSCQDHSTVNSQKRTVMEFCQSFHLNIELNNVPQWVVPSICDPYILNYIHNGQYMKDVELSVDCARQHLKNIRGKHNTKLAVVFDIDETALSNIVHIKQTNCSPAGSMECRSVLWTEKAVCSPDFPVSQLYQELFAANWSIFFISERPENLLELTEKNLIECGYGGWTSLILRSSNNSDITVEAFKGSKMNEIEEHGYQIVSVIGDQWSDLGMSTSRRERRLFKLPNPIYQVV
ncbi:hypothetical protein KP509_28G067900 [Ceratopteris richardii]|uniref:Acid phosphatase n=1 Tax=Ceratopteris richardii TaxID=49495 RepID=A0A8T2RD29_CERRI|nr:hypothetical protein KP509_28G067900 [Ceratopteris richardii]